MVLKQKPFVRYNLDDEQDTFTVRLNENEKKMLLKDRKFLKQVKQSTAIKQMWKIGRVVTHDPKYAAIIDIILGNESKNERQGIIDAEDFIEQS